jgi:hypothetical protein
MRIMVRSIIGLLAMVMVAAFAGRVLAQGYDGLMSPASPAETAPAKPDTRPPGYEGVMPGWTPPPPKEEVAIPKAAPPKAVAPPRAAKTVTVPAKAAQKPRQTPIPGQSLRKQTPSDELRTLSMLRGLDVDMNKIPDRLEGHNVRLPAASIEALSRPRPRVNGMLPMEMMIVRNVDQIMTYVKNPRLSEAKRMENARSAYKQLEDLRAGLKFKSQAPEAVYRKLGLPDVYIQEEKESIKKTLAYVEATLDVLKGYQ